MITRHFHDVHWSQDQPSKPINHHFLSQMKKVPVSIAYGDFILRHINVKKEGCQQAAKFRILNEKYQK